MSNDKICEFCLSHEAGDTIFDETSWDGGIGFDYIRNIQYCPICGKKLSGNDEEKDNDIKVELKTEDGDKVNLIIDPIIKKYVSKVDLDEDSEEELEATNIRSNYDKRLI